MIPCFLSAFVPKRWRYKNPIYFFFAQIFYTGMLRSTFLPVTYEGKENIPKEPAIFVANHQSSLDIPLLASLMGRHPHVWLFLARFAKIPFFGFILQRLNIVVDHSGLRKLVSSIDQAVETVKQNKNVHVLLFPEGGRYIDGKIHNFFFGFALIAKQTNRPVVPVLLKNVQNVYPPNSFLIHWFPLKVIIGKPLYMQQHETEDDFVQRVHAWFVQHGR